MRGLGGWEVRRSGPVSIGDNRDDAPLLEDGPFGRVFRCDVVPELFGVPLRVEIRPSWEDAFLRARESTFEEPASRDGAFPDIRESVELKAHSCHKAALLTEVKTPSFEELGSVVLEDGRAAAEQADRGR